MKNRLKSGEVIIFQNEEGDLMTLSFRKTLGGSVEFVLELNGVIIKMCKTFEAFNKKVESLIIEINLVEL